MSLAYPANYAGEGRVGQTFVPISVGSVCKTHLEPSIAAHIPEDGAGMPGHDAATHQGLLPALDMPDRIAAVHSPGVFIKEQIGEEMPLPSISVPGTGPATLKMSLSRERGLVV